jgi:hypothetical protein
MTAVVSVSELLPASGSVVEVAEIAAVFDRVAPSATPAPTVTTTV